MVEPAAAAVVAGNPDLAEVIVAPRGRAVAGLRADLAIGRRLRDRAFDLAIDFHGGPRAALLTWLSRARVRVGYEVAGRTWMYTHRVARPRGLRPRHSVRNQWDLLATLGVSEPDPTRFPATMPIDPAARARVHERLAAAGLGEGDRVAVIHVSAGNPFRRWPTGSFAEVAAGLAGAEDLRVVITSGPSDQDAAGRVIARARERLEDTRRDYILSCGEFSLAELRALVERATLFIGGDSGPMHIASTSHVPMVSLYGPTLPARSAPWRESRWPAEAVEVTGLPCRPCDQRVCLPGDFRCLSSIVPSQVLEAAARALSRATG